MSEEFASEFPVTIYEHNIVFGLGEVWSEGKAYAPSTLGRRNMKRHLYFSG